MKGNKEMIKRRFNQIKVILVFQIKQETSSAAIHFFKWQHK